ncbi:MAG TPA: response regulator [Pyrinomonadaceae bacterium]|jgi:PAS domain S-box-containing protein|nr:response regulator [Pyrinomonadaceae bacterium]
MKLLKVLIIEDSEMDAELLVLHLTRAGYDLQFDRIQTAEAMKTALRTKEWDLIVSDFQMPEFTGLEAIKVLNESGLEIPFILISGTIGEETAVQAMLAGVSDYLMKDNLTRLVPAIERELKEAAEGRALKKIELALQESEKRLKLALTAAGMGVWEWNLLTGEIYWSPECLGLLQVEKPIEKISEFQELLHPEDREAMMKSVGSAIEKHTIFKTEFRIIKNDGNYIWVANHGITEYDGNGTALRIIGTVLDITERKQAELSLRESEENFRALVQATTQSVWTMNAEGESEEFPQWWSNLTGQTAEEIKNFGWLDAVHPEDYEEARIVWQSAFASQTLFTVVYRIRTVSGNYGYYAVRGVPVFDETGNFRQWIGTFTDISSRKRAEEELHNSEEKLRQSQKLESIGRLAGGIAHDFNNMLTAINGYSDLMLRCLPKDDLNRSYVGEIREAGERSASLINQLLAFSRRQILQPKVLNINQIIFETTGMLQRLIGEDIQLVSRLDPEIGQIKADPGQISQIIMNLVVNSRDAMPQGGTTTIKTENVYLDEEYVKSHVEVQAGNYVLLAISDSGTGIDEETLAQIFEPFFTTKEPGKGTGLGLATVYGIVNQSGGHIDVVSTVGIGTTFEIYLPRVENAVDLTAKNTSPEILLQGTETIFLVEDEHIVRKLTREILESYGYKVFEARNGEDALEVCAKIDCKFDLLLTDVVMPKMGGFELAEKLLETNPQLRVLFTSGYTENLKINHKLMDTSTNFVQKPFTPESLAIKVRETLDFS